MVYFDIMVPICSWRSSVGKIFSVLLICLLGFFVYSDTFQHFFQFDDEFFITSNPAIRDITNLRAMWDMLSQPSRFVVFYSFALNHHVHGMDVFGYHLTNFVIHLVTAVLVWWLVRMLNRLRTSGVRKSEPPRFVYGSIVALFAALIFVAHPVQTQAVTYITQRFASLATLFYLLSLCFYIKGRLGRQGTVLCFIGAAIASVLGMFCKEIVITLPLMILLVEVFFFEGQKRFRKFIVAPVGLFFLIIPAVFSFRFLGILSGVRSSASHDIEMITFGPYILTQFRVLATFFRLFFVPLGQNFDYDFPLSHHLFEWPVLLSFMALLSVFLLALKLKRRHRLIAFGLLWFLLTLTPNFVPRRHVIFEHKLYLPLVGLSLALCMGMFSVFKDKRKCMAALSIIVVLFSFLAYKRNQVWKNGVTLWGDVVKKSPDKLRGHLNLGIGYLREGKYDAAEKHLNKVLDRCAYFLRHNMNEDLKRERLPEYYFKAYYGRGLVYERRGQYDLALEEFNKTLKIKSNYTKAYVSRAGIYDRQGRYDLAFEDYRKVNVNLKEAYNNRGIFYEKKGQYDAALSDYREALNIDPQYAEVYGNRGIAYSQKKQYAQALADYDKALSIDPSLKEVYFNRSLFYKSQGNFRRAYRDAQKAKSLDYPVKDGYLNGIKEKF